MGPHALLVELDDLAHAQAFHAEVLRRRAAGNLPGVRDIVPAARTVLLDGLDDPQALAADLRTWHIPPLASDGGRLIEIPVRYDGPDLAEVARLWGMPAERVPETLADLELRVAFCGFAPGFGYLSGLPAELHLPRRATPRTAVPAGSVALAGEYAGVYPRSSPGGWQLVGSTDAVLWDPGRKPAALLAPGTRVRFTAADEFTAAHEESRT
ncbi:allophanate hydrolase subunit 1 [Streptomyces sp. NBC_00237]|uniref:5-oxoprolinase subunit B family protein n=1 Tax=Streptomyces sp. NBC_00237 TaxID=2975687 RepID=UPI00224F2467|nr:allophanate hydrolase subunit 1 [Streptomyces sp. NBC_00237]MCX5203477.1 allophanate hydrolase subunit 1 [Streptomyces sp. NBC_00237]